MSEEKQEQTEINDIQVPTNLNVCKSLNNTYAGIIQELDENYAKSYLKITSDLVCDHEGLVHSGFIFSAASYVAQASINNENTSILTSKISFLAPCKIGDEITFEARSKFDNSKKREVKVEAFMRDIKVFDALIYILVTDEHILQMQDNELARYQAKKAQSKKEKSEKR